MPIWAVCVDVIMYNTLEYFRTCAPTQGTRPLHRALDDKPIISVLNSQIVGLRLAGIESLNLLSLLEHPRFLIYLAMEAKDNAPVAFAGPSSKERKYDRQLRLWAASGQDFLEKSRVLLINSSDLLNEENDSVSGVAGAEALKNLVLPGVGGFTIVDPATVHDADLGVNFFLEEDSLGKSRAEEVCRLLKELNPDVSGDSYDQVCAKPGCVIKKSYIKSLNSDPRKPISELLRDEAFLTEFRLILISGPMRRPALDEILVQARANAIPVFYIHSVGFYSCFSVQLLDAFPIVDTHPSKDTLIDLRLVNPWSELSLAAEKVADMDSMDDYDHGHIPYILILLHYLGKWKADHNGLAPQNFKEKYEFRELVRSAQRTDNPEGGEENFEEAVAEVLKAVNLFQLPSTLREIFEMEHCKTPSKTSGNFWIIAAAVKKFHETHGVLPLSGSLPDMKAKSADYISLQNLYKTKAREDVNAVKTYVDEIQSNLDRKELHPIPDGEITAFCKNAAHVRVVHGRSIPCLFNDEAEEKSVTVGAVKKDLEFNRENSLAHIWVAMQIFDHLLSEDEVTNSQAWDRSLQHVISLLEIEDESVTQGLRDTLAEMRRAHGGELHNIGALTGGMVAQEAIKVLTGQYIPVDNTLVFDGVKSTSATLRL